MAVSTIGRLLEDPIRRFQTSLLMLLVLIVLGTIGYMWIGDLSIIDSLYMTIITITTVGFAELGEPSPEGRLFTILLIILGVGTGAWAIRNGVEVILGDTLWHSVQRRRMKHDIENLEGHYIVCGFGRIGRQIARDMKIRRERFVIIDRNAERIEWIRAANFLFVNGDATLDKTLEQAGITRAAGVVVALNSDADNVLAVLTARGLNPDIQIVARAGDENVENKLHRAGADRVVSPYVIGGHRLALSMLQPTVHDFFSHVFNVEQPDVDMGEVPILPTSPIAGKTIVQCNLRSDWNLIIVGIQKRDGTFSISPDAHRVLEPGETLIVLGNPIEIQKFRKRQGH